MSKEFWFALAQCAACLLGVAGAVVIDSVVLSAVLGALGGVFAHFALEIYMVERRK